ncbi:hypothetical protein KQI84_08930 [bacterium]|nr:hypothetical protein [bacterium]
MPRPRRRWIVWGFVSLLVFAGALVGLYYALIAAADYKARHKMTPVQLAAYEKWLNEPVEVDPAFFEWPESSDETRRLVYALYEEAEKLDKEQARIYMDEITDLQHADSVSAVDPEMLRFFEDLRLDFEALVRQPDYQSSVWDLEMPNGDFVSPYLLRQACRAQWAKATDDLANADYDEAIEEVDILLLSIHTQHIMGFGPRLTAYYQLGRTLDILQDLIEAANDPRIEAEVQVMLRRHSSRVHGIRFNEEFGMRVEGSICDVRWGLHHGYSVTVPQSATGWEWKQLEMRIWSEALKGCKDPFDPRSNLEFDEFFTTPPDIKGLAHPASNFLYWDSLNEGTKAAFERRLARYDAMMNGLSKSAGEGGS